MTDDTWKRVERYLDQKASMARAVSYLNTAIRALYEAEVNLAWLKGYPEVGDGKLRSELGDHEERLEEIRDLLIETQAKLRADARKEFTDEADKKGVE